MSDLVELRHLRTLLAVADTGSLSDAAERLHLTQSALSHQLKDLESRLAVTLVHRRSRPLQFTAAGERLLGLARDIVPRVQATERELRDQGQGTSGRLHIAIECHSCFEWLLPALDRFRERWPSVEVDLRPGFYDDAQQELLNWQCDLVITSDPADDPGLLALPLFQYDCVLVLAKDHPLARQDQIQPSDLATETLITYPVDPGRLDVYRLFLNPAGVKPAAVRTCEHTLMMVQLAASRRGVCALPNWVAQEYEERGWVVTRPLGNGVHSTLYAALRKEDSGKAYLDDLWRISVGSCCERLKGIQPVSQTR